MKKLYFKILRWFNDGEPSREEVQEVLKTKYRFKEKMTSGARQTSLILNYYTVGLDMAEVAKEVGVTRERVRQVIRKACRGV